MLPTERHGPRPQLSASERLGRIISSHGRHYMVELEDGSLRKCFPRGKKGGPAVGDLVVVTLKGEVGSIERIMERRNLFFRYDAIRTKHYAYNVDNLLLDVAT